ncbi:MAG: hypothetical protein MZW92_02045 [Comamonadaceae bacterium]|nr:hypothetical protein [Comamonadaceae bacterium]
MKQLLQEIRHNPLLWLLAFVPVVFAAAKLKPEAHTLLFVLSVLAIVPLAALLSHATESVAAKTGDAVGGLLNATLGNLTELVIALTALRAGQYMLVKASIAGAIVTNTLFMLGASFLLGGLKHHVQEYNRVSARMQAGLLFLATIALLIPSAIVAGRLRGGGGVHAEAEPGPGGAAHRGLRAGHAVLAQDAPRAVCQRGTRRGRRSAVADRPGPGHAGRRHGAGGAGERGLRRVGAEGGGGLRDDPGLRGLHRRGAGRRRGGDGLGVFRRAQEPAGPERGHRAGQRVADRAVRRAGAGAAELRHRARRRWTCSSGRARW